MIAQGQVWCRSEFTYATQPVAFEWQGNRLMIRQVVSAWHSPTGRCFRVLTSDGRFFSLDYYETDDHWQVCLD
jgi:hypothetical protein